MQRWNGMEWNQTRNAASDGREWNLKIKLIKTINTRRRFNKTYNAMIYENATINDSCKIMWNFDGQTSGIQIWAKTFTTEEVINIALNKILNLTFHIVGNI